MTNQTSLSNTSLLFFLLLLLTFLSAPAFAQNGTPEPKQSWTSIYDLPAGTTFEELQENFRTYWKNREIGKGHGYKPFKRWEAYMAPRIFPSNDMSLVNNTYFNYQEWDRKFQFTAGDKSFAGNWTPLGPFMKATGDDTGVGRLNMVRIDPLNDQVMYVGAADGGLWKSTNGGASWSTNTDMLAVIGVADLAIHPTNTSIMYLATGDAESDRRSAGILKSTNEGTTWLPTGLSWTATDDYSIRKLLMHPGDSQILLAATNKGVYRTTNGGTTWSAPTTFQNFKDMEFKPGDPNTVYATSNEMWKSVDNGVNWTKITSGVPSADVVRMGLAVTPAEPNSVFLIAGKDSNGGLLGIYKSTDSGTSFVTRFEPDYTGTLGLPNNPNILGNEPDGSDAAGQSFYTLAFAVHPTDPDFLLAGGVSQWASFDGGFTWSLSSHWAPDPSYQFVHADSHEILFTDDGTKAYSCHDGGLAMFTDGTGVWSDLSNNLNISQQNIIGMSATSPNKMAAGLQDIGTILNTAVNTWKVIGGGDGEYCFIDYTNDNNIVETGTNGYHSLSTDGGLSFTEIFVGLPSDPSNGDVEFQSPIHQDPMVSTRYYAGGRKHLYRSNDMGTNWTQLGEAFPDENANITEFKIAPSNNMVIYATNGFNMAKSTDGGATWFYLAEPSLNASVTQLAISNVDPDKVWVTYSGYSANDKVFKSTDGGSNWINISAGLPNIPFNTVAFQNGSNDLVYVGADIGVYHRDNSVASWTPFFTNLPRTRVRDLKIFYPTMKLRAATYGRGTWESDLAPSVLPVELLSFTGTNDGKSNLLEWKSAAEINFDFYELERSNNARDFSAIARVAPQTIGRENLHNYAFNDEAPLSDLNYYRLKMVDLDGTFAYSNIVVLFNEDASTGEFSVFPNPTTTYLNIKGLPENGGVVNVMDQLGRVVIAGAPVENGQVNVSRLPNGVYFIELRNSAQETSVKRFIKE